MIERRVVVVVVRSVGILLAAVLLTWLALPSPIGSLPWIPSPAPALDGPYRKNEALAAATPAYVGQVVGPEDFAWDAEGRAWSGLKDGRIVRFDGPQAGSRAGSQAGSLEEAASRATVTTIINTGGRPLGLEHGKDGFLYVADAERGLLKINIKEPTSAKAIEVLADRAEGYAFKCVNDLEIASDGSIYFTDSSAVWGIAQFTEDILDQRPSGRVIKYDPVLKTSTVLARELTFANGLALLPDESALIIAETGRYRLWKLWLTGDKRNIKEVITENLPGFPDNLQVTPRGTIWVALYSTRKRLLDFIHPYPFFKDATASLPDRLRPKPPDWGYVVEIDQNGVPLRSLQDPKGNHVAHISAAKEHDGVLWLGSLDADHVAWLKL